MSLLLRQISLAQTGFTLEVDVEIRGRVTALFGPSGAGKTSLLDVIAGLRRAQSAFIQLDETLLTHTATGLQVPVHRRGLGYVPQDLALFPHLSVRGNLLYGHRPARAPRFRFDPVVELLELQPLLTRRATELSGGEKQRVALGRALLASPRLLLLDEPLASLDVPLKAKVLPYLARVRDELGLPMLYVTHDRFETVSLADEMVVLVHGQVAQHGAVHDVFGRPANLAVAGILHVETILAGRIVKRMEDLLSVAVGPVLVMGVDPGLPAGASAVHVCIRAEDVVLVREPDLPSSARNHLPATVLAVSREGPLRRVELDCGFGLTALLTKQACEELGLEAGSRVVALVKAPNVHFIER